MRKQSGFFIFASLIGMILGGMLLYQVWVYINVLWLINHNPEMTSFMSIRLDEMKEDNPTLEPKLQYQWVDYNRISNHLKRALIAAEDAKFLDHEGFDIEGIQYAYEQNIKKGRIVAGGSTISQQLAKNLFLSASKNPLRKVQEAIITIMLENTLSKRRILEIYLNVIEWGNGVFGAQAAAKYYYRINANQIAPEQAAKLASMVPNPRFYDTHRNTKGLRHKTNIIRSRMNGVPIP